MLFGGDQLNQLLADTWTFDVIAGKWEEKKPPRGPAPRAGHALLWLPKAGKVLLLGGYTYTSTTDYVASLYQPLPLEAWVYDTAADRWDLLHHVDRPQDGPLGPPIVSFPPRRRRTIPSSCSRTKPGPARSTPARPTLPGPPGTASLRAA